MKTRYEDNLVHALMDTFLPLINTLNEKPDQLLVRGENVNGTDLPSVLDKSLEITISQIITGVVNQIEGFTTSSGKKITGCRDWLKDQENRYYETMQKVVEERLDANSQTVIAAQHYYDVAVARQETMDSFLVSLQIFYKELFRKNWVKYDPNLKPATKTFTEEEKKAIAAAAMERMRKKA